MQTCPERQNELDPFLTRVEIRLKLVDLPSIFPEYTGIVYGLRAFPGGCVMVCVCVCACVRGCVFVYD